MRSAPLLLGFGILNGWKVGHGWGDRPSSASLILMKELVFGQAEHTGNVSLKDFDRVPKLADSIIFEIF